MNGIRGPQTGDWLLPSWDMTPGRPVQVRRRCGGTHCIELRDGRDSRGNLQAP
jgi:hypothetical protein